MQFTQIQFVSSAFSSLPEDVWNLNLQLFTVCSNRIYCKPESAVQFLKHKNI